jgi:hypothetical protein
MKKSAHRRDSDTHRTHPYIRKGYYLGLHADMFVCITCGEQLPVADWDKYDLRRAPPCGLLNEG